LRWPDLRELFFGKTGAGFFRAKSSSGEVWPHRRSGDAITLLQPPATGGFKINHPLRGCCNNAGSELPFAA